MSEAKGLLARWVPVGRELFCPVAVSPEPGQLVLLARKPTTELVCSELVGGHWGEFHSLGIPVCTTDGTGTTPVDWQLAACSNGLGRTDVFARSPESHLLHATRIAAKWSEFECVGVPATNYRGHAVPAGLATAPAACSPEPKRIDLFAVTQTGELLHTVWNNGDWGEFESLGTLSVRIGSGQFPVPLLGPISAGACGKDRIGIFTLGIWGDLMIKWWDGKQWSDFISLGCPEVPEHYYPAVSVPEPLTGPPAVCSWGPCRIDVFVRGPRGDLLHKHWDGQNWGTFESLAMPVTLDSESLHIPFTGPVTACAPEKDSMHVFARAADGNLYHARWDGSWDHE